jgi:hypothetical protein
LSEIGAHAVATAATNAASLHTLRMGRIIAHLANRRQRATRVQGQDRGEAPRQSGQDMERPPSRCTWLDKTEGSGAG